MQTTAPKVRYLPPPVRVEIGVPGTARGVIAGLWCVGAAALWWGLPYQQDTFAIAVAVLLLTAWVAYLEANPRDSFVLDWSATGWRCNAGRSAAQAPSVPCAPAVVLDWQRLMLLRVRGLTGGARWVWCRRQDARQWHRFRCALFAGRQP